MACLQCSVPSSGKYFYNVLAYLNALPRFWPPTLESLVNISLVTTMQCVSCSMQCTVRYAHCEVCSEECKTIPYTSDLLL